MARRLRTRGQADETDSKYGEERGNIQSMGRRDIGSRLASARGILRTKSLQIGTLLLTLLSLYDLVLSQIVPERWVERFPRVRDIVDMSPGLVPWWGYLVAFACVATVGSFEYAHRRTKVRNSEIESPPVSFAPAQDATPSNSKDSVELGIGAVQFVIATLSIDILRHSQKASGSIKVELKNTSFEHIEYIGSTAGQINGIWFDKERIPIRGYIAPMSKTFLVSNRLFDIPLNTNAGIEISYVAGIFEYDISYKSVRSAEYNRRTARGFRINQWFPVEHRNPPCATTKDITVIFYNATES